MHQMSKAALIIGACGAIFIVQAVFASPPGSKYTPGETLDPSCSAGDANCTVTAPLQSSNNLSDVTSASTARSNIGLVINSDVQGYSAALASIAGLTTAANKMIYTTGSNTYATTDLTEAARLLLASTTTGAMVNYLHALTGTTLTDNSVTSAKIFDGTIVNADISNAAGIAYSKLNLAGSIIASDIADSAVTSAKINDGTILNADIGGSASIAFSKLNISSSDILGIGAYSAGTGLQLVSGAFSISSSVVTSNYGGSVVLAGSISPTKIVASTSDSGIPNTMTNTSSDSNAGVLRLSLSNIAAPASTNHYIEFYDSSSLIGSIRGDGAGGAQMSWNPVGNGAAFNPNPGLQFVSSGADYAEYLERNDHHEVLHPGDVVGVKQGKISRSTQNADRAMVVSAQPVVIGNQPAGSAEHFNAIAFVGQVYVRVMGPVTSGQYVVASGKNDGIGIAKYKNELTADDLVVGQAWQSIARAGETAVKVGIVPGPVIVDAQADRLNELQKQVNDLQGEVDSLRANNHE